MLAALLTMVPAAASGQPAPVLTELECFWRFFKPHLDTCRAAARGDADAARRLGRLLAQGEDVPRDDTVAARVFRQAAEAGSAAAAADLGRMYELGRGVPRDHAEAESWYRKAAAGKSVIGMYRLWQFRFLTGSRETRETAAALAAHAEQLAAGNDPDGLFVSGEMLTYGHELLLPVRIDPPEGVRRLRRAAEQGHAEAASALGRFLVSGYPERLRSPREGVRWLEQAAVRFDHDACFALAGLYFDGNGSARITANPPRAMQLYRCAAEQGHAEASYQLGYRSSDKVEERRWYRRAAELGHGHARFMLAFLLIDGRGGPRDERAALDILRRIVEEKRDAAEMNQIGGAIVRHRESSREALELVVTAVKAAMKQRDPELWVDTLALAHLRLGDAARAEALLRAELKRRGDPDNIDAVKYRVALGQVLVALGRAAEARQQWERALIPLKGSITEIEIRYRLSQLDRK
jgi:TPR repeat protein